MTMRNKTSKKTQEFPFLPLFEKFILDSASGRRHQKNGLRLKPESVMNYRMTLKCLQQFNEKFQFDLRVRDVRKSSNREIESERLYWKRFYQRFSEFLYSQKSAFDNYAGFHFKNIRTFFSYLLTDRGMQIGQFHKMFYVRKEKLPVLVLSPERLQFLIHDKQFEESLSDQMKMIKDIFVLGCTLGLRVSDLLSLTKANIEPEGKAIYISVNSRKTHTYTRILIPDYAINIINRNRVSGSKLLPPISNSCLNKKIKLLGELAGWTEPRLVSRERQGKVIMLFRNSKTRTPFRFCDLITSHMMRRTAISTFLRLGMPEHLVRKISGHSPGSREFYRYVEISQSQLDDEARKIYRKLENCLYEKQ